MNTSFVLYLDGYMVGQTVWVYHRTVWVYRTVWVCRGVWVRLKVWVCREVVVVSNSYQTGPECKISTLCVVAVLYIYIYNPTIVYAFISIQTLTHIYLENAT